MQGSMEVMANDSHSPCQHFNFTVAPTTDHLEGYNVTCNIKTHTTRSPIMEEDPAKENSINQTCRTMKYPHNCIHISLHLEMDVKSKFLRKLGGKEKLNKDYHINFTEKSNS